MPNFKYIIYGWRFCGNTFWICYFIYSVTVSSNLNTNVNCQTQLEILDKRWISFTVALVTIPPWCGTLTILICFFLGLLFVRCKDFPSFAPFCFVFFLFFKHLWCTTENVTLCNWKVHENPKFNGCKMVSARQVVKVTSFEFESSFFSNEKTPKLTQYMWSVADLCVWWNKPANFSKNTLMRGFLKGQKKARGANHTDMQGKTLVWSLSHLISYTRKDKKSVESTGDTIGGWVDEWFLGTTGRLLMPFCLLLWPLPFSLRTTLERSFVLQLQGHNLSLSGGWPLS